MTDTKNQDKWTSSFDVALKVMMFAAADDDDDG
jgi:hypothetical protein